MIHPPKKAVKRGRARKMLPLKDKNILISVDIALNKSGIAILSTDMEVLYTSLLKVTQSWDYYRKVAYLYSSYSDLFTAVLTKEPSSHILVLEGRLKAGWRASSMASIEGARVASYLAYHHICEKHETKPEIFVYDPNVVKYFVASKRSANKDEMYEAALSRFSFLKGLEYQEDEFDAIYLGLYHLLGEKHEHSRRHSKTRKLQKRLD